MPLLWCLRAEYKGDGERCNCREYLCHYYKSTADHLQCNYFHARQFNKAIAHISCIISKMHASPSLSLPAIKSAAQWWSGQLFFSLSLSGCSISGCDSRLNRISPCQPLWYYLSLSGATFYAFSLLSWYKFILCIALGSRSRGVHDAPYLIANVTQSVTLIWRMRSSIEFDCRFHEAFTCWV